MKKKKVRKPVKVGPLGVKPSDTLIEGSVKKIKIDNGKAIEVTTVALSPENSRAVFHCLSHIAALRDAQFKLRGTSFYSSAVERELDRLSSTKLMPVFEQQDKRQVSDAVHNMSLTFSVVCDHFMELSNQPEIIKQRFERDYKDMLIRYGITV